jgi:hypothetical protein
MSRLFVLVAVALVALNAFFWLAGSGLARRVATGGLAQFLFGPRMVRAEVVMNDGSDYLVDRGRLTAIAGSSLTVREPDRTVTVSAAPSAQVTINGVTAQLAALRRGMRVTLVRLGNGPATIVQAQRR